MQVGGCADEEGGADMQNVPQLRDADDGCADMQMCGCATDDKSVSLNSVPWEGIKGLTNNTPLSEIPINDKHKAAPA